MARVYPNRAVAGAELARAVQRLSLPPPVVVLGLPRGGVAVALPVAQALHAPLDVMVVRKIGMPGQPELAIGAIAPAHVIVREPHMAAVFTEGDERFERLVAEQRRELARREHVYRKDLAPLDLKGKTAVLVDDGLATGSTMLAAIKAARASNAARVIAAAPVASPDAAALVRAEADDVVFLETPELFAIGEWYEQFPQLDDAEVCRLLDLGRGASGGEGNAA